MLVDDAISAATMNKRTARRYITPSLESDQARESYHQHW